MDETSSSAHLAEPSRHAYRLPPGSAVIDPIAKLHSPSGALLSVYVNRRLAATRATLLDLLKPYRAVDHPAAKHVRADIDLVLDQAARIESDLAPAVAVFASSADEIFEFYPLIEPSTPVATMGPRPFLRPLRQQPAPMRVGVLLADSTHARSFLAGGAAPVELGEWAVERGKDNYGGFGGYRERKIRSRAEELTHGLWREAGRALFEAHRDQPLDLLVLAGHGESFDEVHRHLHQYLRDLPRGELVIDTSPLQMAGLAEGVSRLVAADRRRRQLELLDELRAESEGGGRAVVGLAVTLRACNAHAVDRIVVAGPFARPGVMCDGCGWLSRAGEMCSVCGRSTFAVDDVVACAMEATVDAGGTVVVVEEAGHLDAHGVGALLRFNVP